MKIKKGDAGYLKKHKRDVIIKTTVEFGIVIALLVLGIAQTKTRMNWLTIVAVLGCLPASKAFVEVIMAVPHPTIAQGQAQEIIEKTTNLTVAFDLVLTSEKKIMPIQCVAISGNTIIGYVTNEKTDLVFAEKHIKQMLYANQYTKVSVKLFDTYHAFLSRAEEMQNTEKAEKVDTKRHEEGIKGVILNLSI